MGFKVILTPKCFFERIMKYEFIPFSIMVNRIFMVKKMTLYKVFKAKYN